LLFVNNKSNQTLTSNVNDLRKNTSFDRCFSSFCA